MLSKQLPALHFSNKKMDDALALAAYDLYLQRIDFQKRFLLKSDVKQLDTFALHIDDNLVRGDIVLPAAGFDMLSERITQVEVIARELIAQPFDYTRDDLYETDPEKLEYAEDLVELRDRWRKILKAQVITRYLDLERENTGVQPNPEPRKQPVEEQQQQQDAPEETGDDTSFIRWLLHELKYRWNQIFKSKVVTPGGGDGPVIDGDAAGPKSETELWQEAVQKVARRNEDFFHRLHQETLQDHYDIFFNAIARAFDPHTTYMAPAKKEDFDIHMRGSLEGIGALLREESGYIRVVRIIPGSASARQGRLAAEDIILQVAEGKGEPVEITDMRLSDAVRLIRGPKGAEVRLTVKKPDGTKEIIPIIRDVVQIEETFVKHSVMNLPSGEKIGYVLIPSFYRDFEKSRNGGMGRNSKDDTKKALLALKDEGVEGIILDLRNNGGGALIDAVDIAGFFISTGPVVQVKRNDGNMPILRDDDPEIVYEGPLVVLVNQFSASASEIVAAALQDYNRAVIVGGKRTHGKGTVQTVFDMNQNIPLLHLRRYDDLGALKVTIQKFYRINGGSTQYKGVEPDVVLPSLYQHLETGEQYLDYSLPWDQVSSADYSPFVLSTLDIDRISQESRMRVKDDLGLQVIAEEAEQSLRRSKETTISLKLADMRAKQKEAQQARERVGEYYRRYQKEQEAQDDTAAIDSKDDRDAWKEEIKQDPYVKEATKIVVDVIAQ